MKTLKPKKTDFKTKIGISLQKIFDKLSNLNCNCSISGSTMVISDFDVEDNNIINTIEETVTDVFECKKAKKYCKLNFFENRLYVRFKNRL